MVPFSADTVNTLRYLVGRDEAGKMNLIKSYIRFGTKASGFVENYAVGGVLCYVSDNENFEYGNLLDLKEIQTAANEFGNSFPQMDYLGFDFVVTNKNEVKILEINSLTSLDTIQLQGSILKTPQGEFFRKRLKTR